MLLDALEVYGEESEKVRTTHSKLSEEGNREIKNLEQNIALYAEKEEAALNGIREEQQQLKSLNAEIKKMEREKKKQQLRKQSNVCQFAIVFVANYFLDQELRR